MISEKDNEVKDSLRVQEYNMINIPSQIATGDLEITSSVIGKADEKDKFEYVVVYTISEVISNEMFYSDK